jgi:CubicO group peptidase (beta-lactamase class C family)
MTDTSMTDASIAGVCMAEADLQPLLDRLREQHRVPGAALGVLSLGADPDQDRVTESASGVLNLDTGVPVRTDSIFQIGSITKTFTATMIMQLVESTQLRLDQPVSMVLPSLRLGSAEATANVTVRQLLCHSSGIDGDVFTDFGRGDDAVSRYVQALADVPQLFTPGTMFSYCNAGYVLAGRLVEEITGNSWDVALRDRILDPLGLQHTSTLPEEAILGTAAVGHTGKPGGDRKPVKHWQLPHSVGPAGLINSTVADVLGYVRMHLRGGTIGDTTIIGSDAVARMRTEQIRQPVGQQRDGFQGLGWMVDHWDGHEVFGHNGATVGQYAYLQAFPDRGIALCLLTNGTGAAMLWAQLRQAVLRRAGLDAPLMVDEPPTQPHPVPADTPMLGRFGRVSQQYDITRAKDGLRVTSTPTQDAPDPDEEPETFDLVPISNDHFIGRTDPDQLWTTFSYGRFTSEQNPSGGDYIYAGTRINPRLR